jgi:hypothetical protein
VFSPLKLTRSTVHIDFEGEPLMEWFSTCPECQRELPGGATRCKDCDPVDVE